MPSLVKATGKWKVQVNRRTNDRGKRFYDVYGFKSKKLAAKFEKEMNLLSKKSLEKWWKEKQALKEADKKGRKTARKVANTLLKSVERATVKLEMVATLTRLSENYTEEDVVIHGTTLEASKGMRKDQGGTGCFEVRLASYTFNAKTLGIVAGQKKEIPGAFVVDCPSAHNWLANASLARRKQIQVMAATKHALRKFPHQYFGKRSYVTVADIIFFLLCCTWYLDTNFFLSILSTLFVYFRNDCVAVY